jgi:hypothetical protein
VNTDTRTEITVETHEVIVIRHRSRFPKPFCTRCGSQALMLTLDEATVLFGYSTRELCRLVEQEQIHFIETSRRMLLVCPESLVSLHPASRDRHTTLELKSA